MNKCPGSPEEQLERSGKKHCDMLCDGRRSVYHCVIYNGRIVEVCAPVEKIRGITKRNDEQDIRLSFSLIRFLCNRANMYIHNWILLPIKHKLFPQLQRYPLSEY